MLQLGRRTASEAKQQPTKQKRKSASPGVHVAGVGASAGGITALQNLFRALPAQPNLCLVVLQHLIPGQATHLAGLIDKWTTLAVREPKDGDSPKPNCVYVASPDHVLTLEAGRFRTAPIDSNVHRPGIDTIDSFFESLARDRGARALAVVLSGAGSDGTAGAVLIKRAGGIVLVQDPITAMHDSMPQAVIASGVGDYILPPDAIAQQLSRCAAPGYVRPDSPVSLTSNIITTLDDIIGLVRRQVGFDLSGYKVAPLVWRVQQRMNLRRVRSFQDYESLLRDDRAELEALARAIPVHVTEFFRDPKAWEALSRVALDPLVFSHTSTIRAWTPACATGEEAYALAMLLTEHLEREGLPLDFQVFATDAYPEIVTRASRGAYSAKAAAHISPERRARFLYTVDGAWRIKRSLRERMVFATQDLLGDPPFSGLDVVTCRNLLIYLDPDASARVLFLLHGSLRLGGYLFLGKGESLSPRHKGFEPVSSGLNIYRKVGPAADITLKRRSPPKNRHAAAVPASAHRAAIAQFDLPSVLVDCDSNILHVYGDTDSYLRLPAGEPTHRLLDLVEPALAYELERALKEALAERRSVTVTSLRDRHGHSLSLRLTPMETGEESDDSCLLVSFLRAHRLERQVASEHGSVISRDLLAADAGDWSEAMRVSHEELEASREELQALNEELKTANDQLNIANEYLSEANGQLQEKIAALEMQSRVLSSGAVMTLFLDHDWRVQWFTPEVAELVPLLPSDEGRRITDLVRKFNDDRFLDDIRTVMQTTEPREAEVETLDKRWFVRRVRPYLTDDNAATGVAITFSDITALKETAADLRRNQSSLAGQNEAFRAAVDDAPLEASLAILIRVASEQMGDDVRCAFYLADGAGKELHRVTGMPEPHADCADGFKVAADSIAGGLVAYTGEAMVTPDVRTDPRWQPWLQLAHDFDYRGYWSFPVETTSKVVGRLAIYHRQPRAATPRDLEVGGTLTRAAAIIISRYQATEERRRAEEALRRSEERLAADLRDTTALRDLAERLVTEENIERTYDEILSTAITLMHSQAGTVQIYEPETKSLVLLVTRNFARSMTEHFHRVDAGSRTACGIALRTGQRTFIDFDVDDADEACLMHVNAGYRSAQATPLVSRKGAPLGMLNTHWHESKHRPTERELRFLDLLARQAADLIEQRLAEAALRASQQRLNAVLDSSADGVELIDAEWRYIYRNEAGRRLLEPRATATDNGMGQFVWDAYPMHVGTPVEAAMQRAMEERESASVTFVFAPTQRTFDARVYPVPGGGISVFYQDVTARKRVEEALRSGEAELPSMYALQRLSTLALNGNTEDLLEAAMDVLVALHAADFGQIQLRDPRTHALVSVAQRGFDALAEADGTSASDMVIARRERVIVDDTAPDANYRTMQSTPLFSASGELMGTVSTRFCVPHVFTEHELRVIDLVARELARALERGGLPRRHSD